MTGNAQDRAALVAGLRELADFLASHPDVPVPESYHEHTITLFPGGGTDDEKRVGVDAAASALGVAAGDADGCGHYRAERAFGPVVYRAVMISSAARARADAQDSYRYSVRVDSAVAA